MDMAKESETPEGQQQPGQPTNDPTNPNTPTPAANGGKKEVEFTPEQQEIFEKRWKERLEKEDRRREAAEAKARKDAEEEAARKNGEWQKLAETREAELKAANEQIAASAKVQERLERYEKALKTQLDAARKDLPKHVTDLLDKLDVAEQLEYIATNAEALKPQQPTLDQQKRVPRTPTPDGGKQLSEAEEAKRKAEMRQSLRRIA